MDMETMTANEQQADGWRETDPIEETVWHAEATSRLREALFDYLTFSSISDAVRLVTEVADSIHHEG